MTAVDLVLHITKILIFLMFLLNLAALATWADRRQSAMVQDRVGPNRATVFLPGMAVRGLLLAPPAAIAAFAAFGATRTFPGRTAAEAFFIGSQVAIFMAWTGLLLLRAVVRAGEARSGLEEEVAELDPRSVAYGGLGLQGAALFTTFFIPDGALIAARGALGGLALVAGVVGVYSAGRVPDGPIPIRLAGTLHALADAIKLVWKEDFIPKNADRLLHALAPLIAMFPALVTCAVVPFGMSLCFQDVGVKGKLEFVDIASAMPAVVDGAKCGGHHVSLQIADLNVGILYLFAMAGTGVIGAAIAGWASDNKYALLGGLRAASQMVSYEVAMGLSLIGLFIVYGGLRLGPMVEWQGHNTWGIFVQPLAFFLFLAALCAETKRVPFDQPEGESEIVAGYYLEYSGMKFGMFMTGEYIELCTSSALLVTLFFGGYYLPFLHADGIRVVIGDSLLFAYPMTHVAVVVTSVLAFFAKVTLMVFVQIFFRWTLPRFRYDQLMKLGWTKLLPLSLANMMVTGVVVLALKSAGPGVHQTLKLLADLTQLAVALGAVAAVALMIRGLLRPVDRQKFIASTAARAANALGGSPVEPQGV